MDAIPVTNVVFADLGSTEVESENALFLGGLAVQPYDGTDHVGFIADAMAQGVKYIGIPAPQGGEIDHFLDIDVSACAGGLSLVITLPPKDDMGFQLLFEQKQPFSLRPDLFDPGERIVVQQSISADRTWASVTFDLDAVANSRIGKAAKAHGHAWIGVPYSLNVIEAAYGITPIVFPHHHTDVRIGAPTGFVPPSSATPNLLGHGGPHPPTSSFLIASV